MSVIGALVEARHDHAADFATTGVRMEPEVRMETWSSACASGQRSPRWHASYAGADGLQDVGAALTIGLAAWSGNRIGTFALFPCLRTSARAGTRPYAEVGVEPIGRIRRTPPTARRTAHRGVCDRARSSGTRAELRRGDEFRVLGAGPRPASGSGRPAAESEGIDHCREGA